jgi:hypothetical protein
MDREFLPVFPKKLYAHPGAQLCWCRHLFAVSTFLFADHRAFDRFRDMARQAVTLAPNIQLIAAKILGEAR